MCEFVGRLQSLVESDVFSWVSVMLELMDREHGGWRGQSQGWRRGLTEGWKRGSEVRKLGDEEQVDEEWGVELLSKA